MNNTKLMYSYETETFQERDRGLFRDTAFDMFMSRPRSYKFSIISALRMKITTLEQLD